MLGSRGPRRILISSGKLSFSATLMDNRAARAFWKQLPIETKASTWGHEIYFPVPIELASTKDDKDVVAMGDIAYWPPGSAVCIFFGRTPASRGEEIRAASPVTLLGKVEGDPTLFNTVETGQLVRVERGTST